MSKEKQIEEMAKISCNTNNSEIKWECAECPFNTVCDIQNSCEALYDAGYRKQSDWISVEERLPDADGKFLCYMLWHNGNGWFSVLDFATNPTNASGCFDGIERAGFYYFDPDWGDVETKEVTHWMPLPEAPKGGEE